MNTPTIVHVIQLVSTGAYVLIAALALRDWLARRDPGRGYLALAIGSLGLVSLLSQVGKTLPAGWAVPVNDAALLAFLASGLGLLLFRDTVVPLGRRLRRLVLGVTGLTGLIYLLAGTPSGTPVHYNPLQLAAIVAILVLWSVSVGEPSVRLWLVSRRLPSVQRARLRALSAGYGWIVVLLASAVLAGSAARNPAGQVVLALAGLLVLPLLYAGFAPPAWLRRTWREREEAKFAQATHDLVIFSPDTTTLATRGLEWAVRLSGAESGFIAYPGHTIIAVHGMSVDAATNTRSQIGEGHGARVVPAGPGGSAAVVSPLLTERFAGVLVLLAGRFSPLFGADEVAWIARYAALLATGLERVRLVEQMSGLNEQLVLRVEEVSQRTTELEAANKELEAFTYTVSHDLRAPLRAINGFASILLEEHATSLSPQGRELLQRVSDNGHHMGRLVDDLLSFSRLGRQPLRTQPVRTGDVVARALEQVRQGLGDSRVEFSIQDLPVCQGDAALLEQVFVNLLSNAVKYSRTREVVQIEVGSRPGEHPGELIFYVKDNGVGFDMRYVGKLFGVFQRLHRAEEYEGTGVGLATVQRIVQRHGGRAWAQSEPGKGATFYFTLPGGHAGWQTQAA